jgi:dTDP-4-dehydrorhamnose 3,5-epimerase
LRCRAEVARGATFPHPPAKRPVLEQLPEHCRLVALTARGDERGSLIPLEPGADLPFEIKRVYYIYGTVAEAERGFHAHRDLDQLAICVAGACTMIVDDGRTRSEVRLDTPDKALLIRGLVWREMRDFSPDAVLLVLASRHYDETDYIRRYEDFLAAVAEGGKG